MTAFLCTLGPALLVGLVAFGMGVLTEALVRHNRAGSLWDLLDEVLVAVAAAAVVYGYEHHRRRAAREHQKLVREMAEQINQAAHIIDYFVHHHTGSAGLDRNVANSLERIRWALHELLPDRPEEFPASDAADTDEEHSPVGRAG